MTISKAVMSTQEVAARFNELAQQEKWFEIQDELFADNVRSVEPPNALHFKYAEGKGPVRKKGEEFVKKVQEFHGASTTQPVIGGNHFSVGRRVDIYIEGFWRKKNDEVMLDEVDYRKIGLEQFFY